MRSVQRGISATFLVIAILAIAIASTYGYFAFSQDLKKKVTSINSFEECAKHYPIMESYPEQCNTPDGKHFTKQANQKLNNQPSSSGDIKASELGQPVDWSNTDHYIQGNFYKISIPKDHKITTGAYGCNFIVEPLQKSLNGKICIVENGYDNEFEPFLNLGYGEKLLTTEEMNINGHQIMVIEIGRDRDPALSLTTLIKDVPLVVGGEKQEKRLGVLSLSYNITDLNDQNTAKKVLKDITANLEILE